MSILSAVKNLPFDILMRLFTAFRVDRKEVRVFKNKNAPENRAFFIIEIFKLFPGGFHRFVNYQSGVSVHDLPRGKKNQFCSFR